MNIDTRLISLKDGGLFAMSWVAGTNPRAIQSLFKRIDINSVDIPQICEEMMECINSEEHKISFRIIFKLCFGTILIFSEQVKILYDVTLNFVCFNEFVLKHYSRKRKGHTMKTIDVKRRRLISTENLDMSNLLFETETVDLYSEDIFELPNYDELSSKNIENHSTCLKIQEMTIRHISWDEPNLEIENDIGEASQEEKVMLLSGLSFRKYSSSRKRKSSNDNDDCSPLKKINGIFNDSIVDGRNEPTFCSDEITVTSLTENVNETANSSVFNEDITQEMCRLQNEEHQPSLTQPDQLPMTPNSIVIDLPTPPTTPDKTQSDTEVLEEVLVPAISKLQAKKGSHLLIDKLTELSKIEFETENLNIRQNCFGKKEALALIKRNNGFKGFDKTRRSNLSSKLLIYFKNNLKVKSQQIQNENRKSIVKEMFSNKYEEYKHIFKIKSGDSRKNKNVETRKTFEPSQTFVRVEEFNLKSSLDVDSNNNCFEESYNIDGVNKKETFSLNCPLNEIDLSTISLDFPSEAGKQRCEFGKEGIMLKILKAWVSGNSNINMNTIITGANRINAALAFHTVLDLAGENYIKIIKDEINSINFIQMGPETIRKINETYI